MSDESEATAMSTQDLEILKQRVAGKLAEIDDMLPDTYRVTLVARYVPDDLDADIVISGDSLPAAAHSIEWLDQNGQTG